MSWKPQVRTSKDDPLWYGNTLRFATREEAEQNAYDLMYRWTAVTDYRAIETEDPVTHVYQDHETKRLA